MLLLLFTIFTFLCSVITRRQSEVTDVGGSKHAVDVTGTFSLLSWIREAQKRLLIGLRISKFITNSVVKKNVHVQSCSQLLSA